jgi:hypothetical protein
MSESQLQTQRLELKYRIPEDLAVRIRDFLLPYLEIDRYGATQPDLSYPVHSLYLDSPDFFTYQSTINGDRNRFKLRIRFYEGRPSAPVFLEIKRRENNAIYKQRCGVRRECVADVMAGRLPRRSDIVDQGAFAERSLHTFCRLVSQLQARPVSHVYYRREAWLSHDSNRIRVTFDRQVQSCEERTLRFDPALVNPVSVFGDEVVLELKFTGRFPNWMNDLVQVFGLKQMSAAKYCDGLDRMKDHLDEPLMPVIPVRAFGTGRMAPQAARYVG